MAVSIQVQGRARRVVDAKERAWLRRRAGLILRELDRTRAELAILITDDDHIQALNRTWRGKDKPTDVLSFPQGEEPAEPKARRGRGRDRRGQQGGARRGRGPLPAAALGPVLLGDVVISLETAARQAAPRRDLRGELEFLLIHGTLHLLGHDHLRLADARRMRREEERLWRALGHEDPPYDEPL